LKNWIRATWLPVALASGLVIAFSTTAPNLDFRSPDVLAWALGITSASTAWLSAWAGWRVVRRGAGGWLAASTAGAAVVLVGWVLMLALFAWLASLLVSAPGSVATGHPDDQRAMDQARTLISVLGLAALAALFGLLGGLLAWRARLREECA